MEDSPSMLEASTVERSGGRSDSKYTQHGLSICELDWSIVDEVSLGSIC